ncbi:MAG TPA: hypothetical protein VHV30_10885, partial [Polyangiaceae bacterium]|nr:hypothetical protein [Polyangiaceae bacterium]
MTAATRTSGKRARARRDSSLRWETLGLGVAIASAVVVAVTAYRTTQELATTTAEVDRTHRTIEALDEVVNAVGAAGNARRVYLFGGEGPDLERFDSSADSARAALAEARALARGSSSAAPGPPDAELEGQLDGVG